MIGNPQLLYIIILFELNEETAALERVNFLDKDITKIKYEDATTTTQKSSMKHMP